MNKRHSAGVAGRLTHRREASLRDLREDLLSRREALLVSVRRKWLDLQPQAAVLSNEVPGELGDQVCLTLETEMTYELLGSRVHMLKQIERALEKIDTGSYGHCEDCDGPITARRLRALPFAIRCTACQDSLERDADMASSARPPR